MHRAFALVVVPYRQTAARCPIQLRVPFHPSTSLFSSLPDLCLKSSSSPPRLWLDMSSLPISPFRRRQTLGIFIPPIFPKLLIFFPLCLFLFSFSPPVVQCREPFLSCSVLFSLRGIQHHTVIHGLLLFTAHDSGREGARHAACCEFSHFIGAFLADTLVV